MPLPKVHKYIQDQNGNVVPEVLCSVYNQGTGVLASLWQDDAGTVPLSNPLTSDAQYGSVQFYINPGHFDLSFTKPGYTFQTIYDMQVVEDVLTLGTMATQNANAVAITGGTATFTDTVNVQATFTAEAHANVFGQLFVGQGASIATNCQALIVFDKTARHGLYFQQTVSDGGGGGPMIFHNAAGSNIGSIATTANGTAYNTNSDRRLKHAIEPLTGALDAIRALRPITHLWNSDGSRGYGFLAHEVQQTLPDAGIVTGEPDAVDDEGQIVPQMYDPSKLVPWLTAALQEAMAQVEALTARVATLEAALPTP